MSNSSTTILDCQNNFSTWLKKANIIYNNTRFDLCDYEDFQTIQYHSEQVIVLPVIDGNSIVLCKVFRQPINHAIWELPAGGVQNEESIEAGAIREFQEETGIQIHDIHRLKPLPSLVVSPNRLPMFPKIFQINLSINEFEERIAHDDEIENVSAFTFLQIREMINSNQIFASIPITILSRFLLSQS